MSEQRKSNGIAIASMVCGLISFCCCNPLYMVSLVAIVLGIVGLAQKDGSKVMSLVGLISGLMAMVIGVIVDIILIPVTFGTSFFF